MLFLWVIVWRGGVVGGRPEHLSSSMAMRPSTVSMVISGLSISVWIRSDRRLAFSLPSVVCALHHSIAPISAWYSLLFFVVLSPAHRQICPLHVAEIHSAHILRLRLIGVIWLACRTCCVNRSVGSSIAILESEVKRHSFHRLADAMVSVESLKQTFREVNG